MSRLEELMERCRAYGEAYAEYLMADGLREESSANKNVVEKAQAVERALRDALEPQGWQLVPRFLTPDMRELMLRADEFTTAEMWTMLLAAAPKEPTK